MDEDQSVTRTAVKLAVNRKGKEAARGERDTGLGCNLPVTPYNMARKCDNAYPYFLVILAT